MYPGVPPEAVVVALPSLLPLQLGLVPVTEAVRAVGCEITTSSVAVQDLESVTVIVYVPAPILEIVAVVGPDDQA